MFEWVLQADFPNYHFHELLVMQRVIHAVVLLVFILGCSGDERSVEDPKRERVESDTGIPDVRPLDRVIKILALRDERVLHASEDNGDHYQWLKVTEQPLNEVLRFYGMERTGIWKSDGLSKRVFDDSIDQTANGEAERPLHVRVLRCSHPETTVVVMKDSLASSTHVAVLVSTFDRCHEDDDRPGQSLENLRLLREHGWGKPPRLVDGKVFRTDGHTIADAVTGREFALRYARVTRKLDVEYLDAKTIHRSTQDGHYYQWIGSSEDSFAQVADYYRMSHVRIRGSDDYDLRVFDIAGSDSFSARLLRYQHPEQTVLLTKGRDEAATHIVLPVSTDYLCP